MRWQSMRENRGVTGKFDCAASRRVSDTVDGLWEARRKQERDLRQLRVCDSSIRLISRCNKTFMGNAKMCKLFNIRNSVSIPR